MLYLKQSTASQSILLGPFVDDTDGATAETGLTIANTDIRLSANGGNMFAKTSGGGTHDENGWYTITLDATDTATVGRLQISCKVAGALAVFAECQVLEEAIYDALFATSASAFDANQRVDVGSWLGTAVTTSSTTAKPEVDAFSISDDATAANNAELAFDGTGYGFTGCTMPTVTTLTGHTAQTADHTSNISAIKTTTDQFVFSVSGKVDTNVIMIQDDSTSAGNLKNMYNTTGYTAETAPASRAQVGSIGTATGGALNFEADTDNTGGAIKSVTFVGVATSGTYASTEAEDGTYHQIDDTGNAIDIVYGFTLTGGRTAVELSLAAYLNGGNDSIDVQFYDFVGTDWETRYTLAGQAGSTNVAQTIKLLSKHTGTGADAGKVYCRFVCTGQSNPTLFVDELLVAGVFSNQTVGYESGAVWLDTNASNTNTESYVDGVADNPVSTIAAATTIAGDVGLQRVFVAPGSTVTLAQTYNNWIFDGHGWTCALGGQDVGGSHFFECDMSGTGTGSSELDVHNSHIGATTLPPAHLYNCSIDSTLTIGSAGDFILDKCYSGIAGASAPTIDMGAAVGATNLSVRDWHGGLTINNLAAGDVVTLDGVFGTVTLNGADAQVELRGIAKAVTNNLTGSPTVNDDTVKADDVAAILADTNELQGDWTDGGRLDLIIDSVLTDTAEIGAAGAGLTEAGGTGDQLTAVPWNSAWDTEVQSEVDDALDTAISELGSEPGSTPTIRQAVMLMYMALRNKLVVQTSGTDALEVYNDAGTKIASKLVTDDGSDYTEAKMS